MNKEKFKYIFDETNKILFKNYYGEITLDDIFSSWDTAINENLIPPNTKGFILDYRQASFHINIKEYSKISDYLKNHLTVFGEHKIAIITEEPKDVIIPTLVETKDDGYASRPFYTMEAAIEWILR